MNYKDEWIKNTNRKIKKLNKFISKSKNLFCKCYRSLIKYYFILNNLYLLRNTIGLKSIVYQTLSEIVDIQREISNHKHSDKIQRRFSKKFRNINHKIKMGLKFNSNKYLIPNFKSSWENTLIKELTRLMTNLESIDLFRDKCLDKQAIKISYIFTYLKIRLPLILENSRFYVIIRTSYLKTPSLIRESEILPSKYRRKFKRTLKDYIEAINSWKKKRYLYIWLTKQIPVLFEHHQVLVEYLFPKNYL